MDKRRAVQKFDGDGGAFSQGVILLAASRGDGHAELRTQSRAARKHGVTHGAGEERRRFARLGASDGAFKRRLDAKGCRH